MKYNEIYRIYINIANIQLYWLRCSELFGAGDVVGMLRIRVRENAIPNCINIAIHRLYTHDYSSQLGPKLP